MSRIAAPRWVVVLTAADGTQSVAGAFRDPDRASSFAADCERLGDGIEAAQHRLEDPALVRRELRR